MSLAAITSRSSSIKVETGGSFGNTKEDVPWLLIPKSDDEDETSLASSEERSDESNVFVAVEDCDISGDESSSSYTIPVPIEVRFIFPYFKESSFTEL